MGREFSTRHPAMPPNKRTQEASIREADMGMSKVTVRQAFRFGTA